MTRLRGGVFGCGMISEFHLRGWQRIPEVEIVALGNRTIARAEARRDQFFPAARVYDDLSRMLDAERLDFVDILTVPWLHKEHCLLARQAGAHVICQKPLCERLEDAAELVAAMAASPKLFAVHENHRYRPWFRRVQALVREGFFGTPGMLRLHQHDAQEPPEAYKVQTRWGILLEYGTHLIDMLVALFRAPQRAYARLAHLNPRIKGESHALAVYEYPGLNALLDIAWPPDGPAHAGFLLQGDRGTAIYEGTMARGTEARFRVIQGTRTLVDEVRSPYDDYVESFYLLERECADAMLRGTPVTQTGAENLVTLTATFAAYRAAAEGRIVSLAEMTP
ncbi:MAG: Gfo/Idh/MocA family protein [Candidatus Methylomirabilales bacterium]